MGFWLKNLWPRFIVQVFIPFDDFSHEARAGKRAGINELMEDLRKEGKIG